MGRRYLLILRLSRQRDSNPVAINSIKIYLSVKKKAIISLNWNSSSPSFCLRNSFSSLLSSRLRPKLFPFSVSLTIPSLSSTSSAEPERSESPIQFNSIAIQFNPIQLSLIPTMSAPSLYKQVVARPWLKRILKPVASWYTDAAGYRKMGLKYAIAPCSLHILPSSIQTWSQRKREKQFKLKFFVRRIASHRKDIVILFWWYTADKDNALAVIGPFSFVASNFHNVFEQAIICFYLSTQFEDQDEMEKERRYKG